MCGIAGVWHRDGARVPDVVLQPMTDALAHRGPDGEGTVYLGNIGLGHRRLSIIDLTPAADQPMSLPDRSLWTVFNGEIHNYLELRRELRDAGARFTTETDTEIVLWAYRFWGEDCFERFNGMWAIALWDTVNRRLTLSRDRFGIKPLYYSVDGSRVAFASEVKSILAGFPVERRVHWQTAYEFMAGGWPHAGTRTFFENVRCVPPAHNLVFETERQFSVRYWRFEPGLVRDDEEAPARLRELLDDAVRLRLRSDVPVGVCLSGGLDSSIIARLMNRQVASPFECYSLRYPESPIDESSYAAMVADDRARYQLNWVHPETSDFVTTLEKIVWHYDAPSALRGKYPKWFVMKTAAERSKVLLGGHGADELLGGYRHFVVPYLIDRFLLGGDEHERAGQSGLRRAAGEVADVQGAVARLIGSALKNLLKQKIAPAGWPWQSVLSPESRGRFVPPAPLQTRSAWFYAASERPFASRFESALWFELATAGLPESLHAEDATSMAFGIESRVPFLDHRVVEYCFSLPFHRKLKDGWTKWPLRAGSEGLLPDEIRWRRKKSGYPGAYADWMTEPRTLAALRDIALDGPAIATGFLDRSRLQHLCGRLDRFANFVRSGPERAWRLLTFQLWYDRFIADPGTPA